MKILYIFPEETGGKTPSIPLCLIRISNYLNSKKNELPDMIDEEIIDLRFENLPLFSYNTHIKLYRKKLISFFSNIYKKDPFDIVAISCYSSFEYLNTIEIASIIKYEINSQIIIIVGGHHPTYFPQDFQINNIPKIILDGYNIKEELFDFIIQGEGEKSFFKLIKKILIKKNNRNKKTNCAIINGEPITSLNELPLIDLQLVKKYKEKIKLFNTSIFLDMCRGCMYKCNFCITSTSKYPDYYKHIRYKSIKRCIAELEIILSTSWLKNQNIGIHDPLFFPKLSYRKEFYKKLFQLKKRLNLKFNLLIRTHILLISEYDLLKWKNLDIIASIGFETPSILMLKILKKSYFKTEEDIKHYIKKAEEIMKFASNIKLDLLFNLMFGVPGETREVIKQIEKFFFEKRFEGKSLIEKYHILLAMSKYVAYPCSKLYETCESLYGTQIFFKEWWKIPFEDHKIITKLVRPSKDLSFKESLILNYQWLKKYFLHINKHYILNKKEIEIEPVQMLREGFIKYFKAYETEIENNQ